LVSVKTGPLPDNLTHDKDGVIAVVTTASRVLDRHDNGSGLVMIRRFS